MEQFDGFESGLLMPGDAQRFHSPQLGSGYDRRVIGELFEKIRYDHPDPITRGLCTTSEQWKW